MFNCLFSWTTWVSRYQKGKTSLDLNEARDDGVLGWQWHQLKHMQTICTLLQTDNHTNTSSRNFHRLDALPDAQPTLSNHWRHNRTITEMTVIHFYCTQHNTLKYSCWLQGQCFDKKYTDYKCKVKMTYDTIQKHLTFWLMTCWRNIFSTFVIKFKWHWNSVTFR